MDDELIELEKKKIVELARIATALERMAGVMGHGQKANGSFKVQVAR